MKRIQISGDFSLPLEVVTQSIAILAKKGAGKSYCMRKISEQIFKAGQQICIIDPKGDQYGIRYNQSGKGAGLPIIILGGEHGDVSLEVNSGAIVAKLIVEEHVSVLLDLSHFRKHEVATFMAIFLEEIYRLKAKEQHRTPLMLIVDEADAIAPQKPMPNEARMLGAIDDIVRRGRQRGIGCTLVTQRSAVLNKNVLTQTQVLVCLRTISPQDLKAIDEWIEVYGEKQERGILMSSLPSLPIGDAWFWSPGWPTDRGIFQKVRVGNIETFDSGATPKPGESRATPKGMANIDINALKRQMSEVIEKSKADDPKELRKKITELEIQVKKAAQSKPIKEQKSVVPKEINVVDKKLVTRLEKLYALILSEGKKHGAAMTMFWGNMDEVNTAMLEALKSVTKPQAVIVQDLEQKREFKPRPIIKATQQTSKVELPIGEQAILRAVIMYPDGIDREALSVLTTYKRSSRDAYVARLSAKGYITTISGGLIKVTTEGTQAMPNAEPLPTGSDLRSYWLSKLPEGEAKVLQILIDAYPNSIERSAIDEQTEYKRSSRDAYLSRMIAKKIVISGGQGMVKASDNLFDL